MNPSGEVETQFRKSAEQATWLKTVTPSMGSFFALLIPMDLGLGAQGSRVLSRQKRPADDNHSSNPGAPSSLGSFTRTFEVPNHQASDLPEAGASGRE